MKHEKWFDAGLIAGAIVVIVGLFLLPAALIFFSYNIVAQELDWRPLSFWGAVAASFLIGAVGLIFRGTQ